MPLLADRAVSELMSGFIISWNKAVSPTCCSWIFLGSSATGSKMASYFPAAAGSPVTNTGTSLFSPTMRLSAI